MSYRPTIENLRNLGHHATYFHWGVEWLSLPALLSSFSSADLNTRAISIDKPTRTITESEIANRGHKVYQHGICTYNAFNLSLHEAEDTKVGDFSEAWLDIMWNPVTGLQAPKPSNQASILLTLLNSMDAARKHYTTVGIWPTSITHGSSYNADNTSTVTLDFSFRPDYYLYS